MTRIAEHSKEQIESIIRGAVAHVAELDESYIESDTHFIEDLGMDSMLLVEVLTLIESQLGIQVQEDYLAELVTLAGCMQVVETVSKTD